jgi:D-serine deaminase-like pyridoxal phosphate-dependent protein
MNIYELRTPALLVHSAALEHNLAIMHNARPRTTLRPHVKAHKCTALARRQVAHGHTAFTCATPREVIGMATAGLGRDLLLANEVLDRTLLGDMAAVQHLATVHIAVDSVDTIDAAADAGLRYVLIDVNIGLPRCGCAPADAGVLADHARSRGLFVSGVMGYEGHLMMVSDRDEQKVRVDRAVDKLLAAHLLVGGEVISGGGTGTYDLHDQLTEVQAGSYALMDTHYAQLGLPFQQACTVLGTVISTCAGHSVVDVGLKALGMDHGNPQVRSVDGESGDVWFVSDEHTTFSNLAVRTNHRVHVLPAHIDPTMALHDVAWVVDGDEVVDQWRIDLRGW